jgi:hypothetical protein
MLEGKLDSLACAVAGAHRVVAPFPVEVRDGKAHIQAREGITYQIVVDGERIIDVRSKGIDEVQIEQQ